VLIAAALGAILVLAAVQRELRFTAGAPSATPLAAEVVSPKAVPVQPEIRPDEPTPPSEAAQAQPVAPLPADPDPVPAATPPQGSLSSPTSSSGSEEPTGAQAAGAESPAAGAADHESGEQRYASTWVNVRARPSVSAPVVRVLSPGDPVVVNSLRQGWYLAEVEGHTLGYVDRTLVGTDPDPASP